MADSKDRASSKNKERERLPVQEYEAGSMAAVAENVQTGESREVAAERAAAKRANAPRLGDDGEDLIMTSDGYRVNEVKRFRQLKTADEIDNFVYEAETNEDGNEELAQAVNRTGALRYGSDGRAYVDQDAYRTSLKKWVRDSRSSYMSRDGTIGTVQSNIRERTGVSVTEQQAERAVNNDEAIQAEAYLKLADAGGVRLTDPQRRRLETAARGGYTEMAFAEVGESGTFENESQRRAARRSGLRRDSAEYRRRKDDFDRQMGRGRYATPGQPQGGARTLPPAYSNPFDNPANPANRTGGP